MERNCGPPGEKQYNNTLLMREILPGIGNLGPMFWASNTAPEVFAETTKVNNIPTLQNMSDITQMDIKNLTENSINWYCKDNIGSLKCEACPNGCQNFETINISDRIANERSFYTLPDLSKDVCGFAVIFFFHICLFFFAPKFCFSGISIFILECLFLGFVFFKGFWTHLAL